MIERIIRTLNKDAAVRFELLGQKVEAVGIVGIAAAFIIAALVLAIG